MLKIRLQRVGRKGMPVFKIVVAEHTMPIQGRSVEKLGSYISGKLDEMHNFKKDRAEYWLSVGAQPSQTVASILVKQGIKDAAKYIKVRKQMPSNAELKAAEDAKAAQEAAKVEAEEAKAAKEAEAVAKKEEESKTEEAKEVKEEKIEEAK